MANQTSDNGTQCYAFVIEKFSDNLHAIVVLAVFGVAWIVLTSLYNATLIIALCRYTKTCLSDNNVTKVLMCSMTFVDLLMSFIVSPPGIILLITNGKWILGLTMFKVWESYGVLLWAVSVNHILCMAFDKYLAICQPTRYMILPNKTGYILIMLSWLVPSVALSIMFCLPGQGVRNTDYDHCFNGNIIQYIKQDFFAINFYFTFALIYVPLLLTYILYILIYLEIRQWSKRATKSSHMDKCSHHNVSKSYVTNRLKRTIKALRTIAAIVIGFTICWLPALVINILLTRGYPINIQVFQIGNMVTFMNCTLNPLLILGVKFVRSALKDLLC